MGEAFITRRGSGGSGVLNFAVKAYASVEDLPETAADNTIALITDVEISSWCFSNDEPAGGVDGSVWIATGEGSICPFNAMKKSGTCLAIYPVSTKQYISGVWVNTEAFFYNGEWTQFSYLVVYLYNNGDTAHVWQGSGENASNEMIMSVERGQFNGGYGSYGHKYASEPIEIPTGMSKLSLAYYCTGDIQTAGTPTRAFVLRTDYSESTRCSLDNVVASVSIPYSAEETVVSIDIPDTLYGQKLYVGCFYNSEANVSIAQQYHIARIWFDNGTASAYAAMFALTRNANTPVTMEIDGVTYGVGNATVNKYPTAGSYDFTVL